MELKFGSLVLVEGGKPETVPGENPSEQGQEKKKKKQQTRRRVRESYPGHIGRRRVLSPDHCAIAASPT